MKFVKFIIVVALIGAFFMASMWTFSSLFSHKVSNDENSYVIGIDVEDEEILDIYFHYKEKERLKREINVVYVETEEKTHIFDREVYENVEFVKSDKSTLTIKDKASNLPLGMKVKRKFVTIYLDEMLMSTVSELYEEEYGSELKVLDESKYDN